jgi:Sulfatase-modifying factor enzyme 1
MRGRGRRQAPGPGAASWRTFALLGFFVCACRGHGGNASPAPSAHSSASAPSARRPKQPPLAGERVDIPEGAFQAGSVPGTTGRVPELEPRQYRVELGPYQIDRLPYPNDPSKPPLTHVTRNQAEKLCSERGSRLCTELEWERACKGPDSDDYLSGASWDPRCAHDPKSCTSGFDVVAIGAALREWTASDVLSGDKSKERAAVRGAAASAPGPAHRCAAREAVDPTRQGDDLGFRCCRGAPNAAVVKEPTLGEIYHKTHIDADRLQKLLAQDPATQSIAHDILFFHEPDSANTVIARGPGDKEGFDFTVLPLLWHPVAGAEYLIVAGRSGKSTSFVVAYYVLGKDSYKLASSFIMQDEPGPVALAYSDSIRPRLHFSTCWGCPGETGKILFRAPDSVVIMQP